MGKMKLPFCAVVVALCALCALQAAESHDADSLDVRLIKFHSCLHRAESASHCMHLRPAELDDHVDDDDIGEYGEDYDTNDEYGIGEGESAGLGRGGGFMATGGSMSLGGGANAGGEEELY